MKQENPGTQESLDFLEGQNQVTEEKAAAAANKAETAEKAESKKPSSSKSGSKKAASESKPVWNGSKNMVTVLISNGNRFDPKTGKEVNPPKKVRYSHSEWQAVKSHAKSLGIDIVEVLYNPFDKED